jgi:acyl-CoA thioester hydrolase
MEVAMPEDLPATGRIDQGCHRFPVRVYFEDTDFSGLVYHANYLRFMERARSDLLQVLGIDQRAAFEAGQGVYAVASLAIRYALPARLGDALLVETRAREIGAATLVLAQAIRRDRQLLTEAEVRIAFLSVAGRPQRQPADWLARYRAGMPETGDA